MSEANLIGRQAHDEKLNVDSEISSRQHNSIAGDFAPSAGAYGPKILLVFGFGEYSLVTAGEDQAAPDFGTTGIFRPMLLQRSMEQTSERPHRASSHSPRPWYRWTV